MERNRARIISLALLWCLTAVLFVEGRSFSRLSMKSGIVPKNSKLQSQGRRLSAVLDIEKCTWMQDSSCQINPEYARVLLSNSTAFSNKAVLEAVIDEASCLSITHEAACSSRKKKCEWAEREAIEMRGIQSHCQYKDSRLLWRDCAVARLRSFVEHYMVCRRRQGGSCSRDHNCELVKIRDNEEGCGLMANRVLDLIVQSPASQTEIISTLVESTIALREIDVPDLDDVLASSSGSSADDDYRRRLLNDDDDDAVDDMLAVDEGSESELPTSRSVISGAAQDEEYEASSDSERESNTNTTTSSSSTEESSPKSSTSPESAESSVNSTSNQATSNNNTALAGSVSYIVSTNASSEGQEETGHDAHSTSSIDSIQAQINDPIELVGSIEHLREIDSTISVSLNHVADALDVIATLIEEGPVSEDSQNLFYDATRILEIMRYRLDSQMDNQDEDKTWTGADKVWWRLQHTVQDLDILTSEEARVSNNTVQRLVEACEIARSTWADLEDSEAFSTVSDVETRLKNSLRNGSAPDSRSESVSQEFDAIESLEEFVSNVVGIFNPTLVSLYPQQLNISFAKKYEQVWVEALAKRNKKWKDIKTLVSNHSNMGQQVEMFLKQLHLVKPIRESDQRIVDSLEFRSLKSMVDEMVGALSASQEPRYSIRRLPESLMTPGLTVWQMGPQVTADATKSALREDASEYSLLRSRNNTIPISSVDAMRRHLASLSGLIEAKITKTRNSRATEARVRSIPETTGILRSVESALNLLKKWNDLNAQESAQEQNYYGTKTTTDFALSLVGCLVLSPDRRGQCRNLDRARCTRTQVHYGNTSSEISTEADSLSICAPEGSEQRVTELLQTPEQVSKKLAKQVAVLFFTTAYCPTLSNSACKENDNCSPQKRSAEEEVCRPSSDIVNYHIEANNIITAAAREESCRSYLGFPICSDLMTEEACNDGDSCLWIVASHGEDNASNSSGICMTNWAQQLFQLNSTALNNSAPFHHDFINCQNQTGEELCGTYGLEGFETNGRSQTSLPKSSSSVRSWIVSCLTVVVTVLFLMVIYISCKIHKSRRTPSKLIRSKKGRPRKTKTEATPQRLPPFPMYSHVFELSPFGSPSQKKKNGAFPYDVSALENEDTGSQRSRLRVPLQQDSRMERYTSATTAEISEIQPISEVEEIQPVSESEDEDSEDSWSSSEGWSEDSDEDSENGSGSPHQNACQTGV